MMKIKFFFSNILLYTAIQIIVLGEFAHSTNGVEISRVQRPPQFVLLAFDGSYNNDFWTESLDFADTVKTSEGTQNIRFTYFINPTYFLAKDYKSAYKTPGLGGSSVSCIGWSDSVNSIPLRLRNTNKANSLGHEIGSHANSHCDASGVDKNNPLFGHAWTEENWNSEFDQFNNLLFNNSVVNHIASPVILNYNQNDIVGFRAPLLATTPGLWPALKSHHFRYDTSKISEPTYWPQRMNWGGWNFPLAQIKIAGTTRKTLSMDYNWLYFHSAGVSKPNISPAEKLQYKNQMLDSYKYYFKINYFGGRGPIHIGHHFSKWNGGAYWEAMQEFTKFVCSKKEVKCVTYKEYADWLDQEEKNGNLAQYYKKNFDVLPDDKTIKDIAEVVMPNVSLVYNKQSLTAQINDEDMKKANLLQARVELEINFKATGKNEISRDEILAMYPELSNSGQYVGKTKLIVRALLKSPSGKIINSSSFNIYNFNKENENAEGPLENYTTRPETSEAHNEIF